MTTLETLVAARKLIEVPEHWCQVSLQKGDRFCAMGAVRQVGGSPRYPVYRALDEVCGMPVEKFNDSHTHAEVLAAFDAAIAREKTYA